MNLKNIIKSGMALLLGTVLITACKKTFDEKVSQVRDFSTSSMVQVYNGTVSASRNFIYVDTKPINGSSLTFGGVFPGTGYGFNVPSGSSSFLIKDTLSTATQSPLNFTPTLEAGKKYTIFMYDTITAAKQKTVETEIVVPADTSSRIRFANFVFSQGAVPAVDIYSTKKMQNIFSNVNFTDVTAFIPFPSGLSDTLMVREAGTTTNLAVMNGINPTAKRSYTLVFKGRYETTSGSIARSLSVFPNY